MGLFQSTLPLRGATRVLFSDCRDHIQFQSTLPLRGATDHPAPLTPEFWISIHAPLTGSDVFLPPFFPPFDYFNPRSPYGERPARFSWLTSLLYFNPRSPYGERHGAACFLAHVDLFQSTLPLRGATIPDVRRGPGFEISIHAPLTGSDLRRMLVFAPVTNFNPRSPYGERHIAHHFCLRRIGFQSTLPLRGATRRLRPTECGIANFNPRSPYGERLQIIVGRAQIKEFQSTLPLRGATSTERVVCLLH